MNSKMAAGVVALIAGLGLAAACTTVTTHNQPTPPASTVTRSPAPTGTAPASPPPASSPSSGFAQDIINAGINAPVDWLNRTGEQLCADWRNGMTTSDTNSILLAGGVHANHLDVFNQITNSDLCPDVSPSPLPLCVPECGSSRRLRLA